MPRHPAWSVPEAVGNPKWRAGLRVELLDLVLVFLADDLPAHLHGRRELAALDREFARDHLELLDRLYARQAGIYGVDLTLQELEKLAVTRGRRRVARLAAARLRIERNPLRVQGQKHGEVAAPVAHDDGLAHDGDSLQVALDQSGPNVLPTAG